MKLKLTLLSLLGSAVACANILPPPGFNNLIVLCDTNNTNCVVKAQTHNGSVAYTGTAGTDTFTASSNVSQGVLKAYASYTSTAPQTTYTQFQGMGNAFDNLTINAAGLTGQVGYLDVSLSVTGSATPNANAGVGIAWQDSVGTAAVQSQTQYVNGAATVTFNPIAFHYGSAFQLQLLLAAITYPSGATLTGTADFSHTAVLSGLQTMDSLNQTVVPTSFASASGAAYTSNGIAPEPGTFVLLGLGIAAFAAHRLRSRPAAR
jgi:hypothetical protein